MPPGAVLVTSDYEKWSVEHTGTGKSEDDLPDRAR